MLLQPTIKNGFTVLEKLRNQIVIIQKFGDMINANKDFTYQETVSKARKNYNNNGYNTTTCLNCNKTCHNGCVMLINKNVVQLVVNIVQYVVINVIGHNIKIYHGNGNGIQNL